MAGVEMPGERSASGSAAPPKRRRLPVPLREHGSAGYELPTTISIRKGGRMPVRMMLDPLRRRAGHAPTPVGACILVATALASQAAGQDEPGPGEAIPYFIDDGAGIPGYQPSDDDLARAAFDAWARESGGRLRFVETAAEDALIHVVWIDPGSSVYGEMRTVVVDGRARALL